MSKRGLIATLVCALVVGVPAAHASTKVQRPAVTWVRGDGSYTKASRSAKRHTITTIVIHATDGGTLSGNVWWLSGGHSHASAHYVISRDGSIVQLVHLSDIAWHAGNWKVNVHSIGVEHVGDTYDPAGFTAAEYVSSARLVAWLVRRYDIPVDRKHIIGHSQVPDPDNPQLFGGSDHHSDPGPHWRWAYYLGLVRRFAFPDRYALHVDTTTIDRDQRLTGVVPWRVRVKGAVRQVDFLVDGEVVWRDSRRPFAFAGGRGWNTTQLANGTHVLAVRATGRGRSALQTLTVHVANRDFALTTSRLHAWQKVRGVVRIRANVRGARTTGIGLYVDGRVKSRDRTAPFTLRWNSRSVHDGKHRITLAAVSTDGRVVRRTLPLVVSNHPRHRRHAEPKKAPPKPKPKPALSPVRLVSQTILDGSTVSGVVTWGAHTVGPVARVQFLVDGAVLAAPTTEPWQATWDTTSSVGAHTLTVRALRADGTLGASASVSVTVTAAQPPPPPPSTPSP